MLISSSSSIALRSSWLIKLVECLFLVTAIYNSYNNLFLQPFNTLLPRVFGVLNPLMTVAGLLFCILFPIYWHRKAKKGIINSDKLHAWFRGILRYWLAISICTYGFAKILGTQFAHTYSRDDSLVSTLSGYDLTWYYFGHSYALSVIIGLLQIVGAIFLLFRRTTLLAAVILFPVMFNILLINWFYDITAYALLNSVLYTLGLLYLLFLRWNDIMQLLFQSAEILPRPNVGLFRYILRFIVVAYSFGLIYYLSTLKSPGNLVGKWQVDQFIRNKDTLHANAWLTDSSAWKNIYIEKYGSLSISANPYMIDKDRVVRGSYNYDSDDNILKLILGKRGNKKDTFDVMVNIYDQRKMKWKVLALKDTLLLDLSKVEKSN